MTLNVNKNTEPVRALGKMLLQNLQLVVGKRYESEAERKRMNKPIFSVVLDEFAPFGYRNFAQILQTARGTNTAFIFSMQSLPQLLQVGKGFKEDVTSAPNTKISLRTQDEETAKFFIRASAEHTVMKRTVSLQRGELFGWERFEKGTTGSEREEREYRAEDERIKNLPKGQMQILMTDDTEGTLHRHLHVRPPQDVGLSDLDTVLAPRPGRPGRTLKGPTCGSRTRSWPRNSVVKCKGGDSRDADHQAQCSSGGSFRSHGSRSNVRPTAAELAGKGADWRDTARGTK